MDSPGDDAFDNELDVHPDDPSSFDQQTSGSKRRRIARACDLCRKKKIKCDGKMPSCTHCQHSHSECIFTVVEKKRNPPKGAKYIEGLENRLRRMESLLQMTGLTADDTPETIRSESKDSPNKTGSPPESPAETQRSSDSSSDALLISRASKWTTDMCNDDDVLSLNEKMSALVTDTEGSTRYIGSSSGFSLFTPRGIEWVTEHMGDTSLADALLKAGHTITLPHGGSPYFSGVFTRRIFQPLPSKGDLYSLVRDYFNHFNFCVPIYREDTFMKLLERHYSSDPPKHSSWWATLNIVLAMAYRIRILSRVAAPDSELKSRGHFKNAMAVSAELASTALDLLSAQALLGMSMFLQGTSRIQSSFFLVSAAVRMAHSIGLHKRGLTFGIKSAEAEERRRVFWIAYILDKDLSLRAGWPPLIDDDDISVELPTALPDDNAGLAPLKDGGSINLFVSMVRLSQIESKIYKGLYTVKASKQTAAQLVETISSLDSDIEAWKESIPAEYRPSRDYYPQMLDPFTMHVVFIHLIYYHCVSSIHRVGICPAFWSSRFGSLALVATARPINSRILKGADICVDTARQTINLLKRMAPVDYACTWMMIYFPVASMATLFVHILQNPHHPLARNDLKMMGTVISIVGNLSDGSDEGHGKKLMHVAVNLEQISRNYLERYERSTRNETKKRKNSNSWPEHPSPPMETNSETITTLVSTAPSVPNRSELVKSLPMDKGTTANRFQQSQPLSTFPKPNDAFYGTVVLPTDIGIIPGSENWPNSGLTSRPNYKSLTLPSMSHGQKGFNGVIDGEPLNVTNGSLVDGFSGLSNATTDGLSNQPLLDDSLAFLNPGLGQLDANMFDTSAQNLAASTLSSLWQMPLMGDWDWEAAIASATIYPDGSGTDTGHLDHMSTLPESFPTTVSTAIPVSPSASLTPIPILPDMVLD